VGLRHAALSPYDCVDCRDGQIVVVVQNPAEWRRFCAGVLERPELADDPRFSTNSRRFENLKALDAEIEAVFGRLGSEQVIGRLDETRIANARLRSVRDFLEHPQLEARDRWREVGSPAGPLRALLPPVIPGGAESVMSSIPEVGEHTDAILAELGFGEEEVAALRREEAV
jgi:crotonobetainyl-CoA:carnitine CoA-transferase CaiB-like acyl-CoA transferase